MSEWAQKRFWTETQVVKADGGYSVALDGRAIKTPWKSALVMPSKDLATAVAQEWDAQDGVIDPLTMPATRYANSAIDKVASQHKDVADMLCAYGETDLLCYRAEQPTGLIARQKDAWDPLLDWAHSTFGARLATGQGVMYVAQEAEALTRLAHPVHKMTAFELAAFHDLVTLSGSLVIGLAASHQHRPIEDLWHISRIDEDWQIEQWGADEEAAEFAETKRIAFENAHRFYHWVKKTDA
ncbi:ATP12 family chaperone protein [Nereida sp. MMG025]|uniref:ATP12 family chaperone protein n=1 Tax=Nereida sp. MMG025 TaxID=2909981 RepID=UPI001F1CDA8E|nr:ATP12 family protein [Nereida sp. MMG025]MCF6444266.1 ATPase [Nereida sp. MMG025]